MADHLELYKSMRRALKTQESGDAYVFPRALLPSEPTPRKVVAPPAAAAQPPAPAAQPAAAAAAQPPAAAAAQPQPSPAGGAAAPVSTRKQNTARTCRTCLLPMNNGRGNWLNGHLYKVSCPNPAASAADVWVHLAAARKKRRCAHLLPHLAHTCHDKINHVESI